MKKMMLLMVCLVLLPVCLAQVKITEVYYDPIGTESGGEVVELQNQGSAQIDVSGWVLATPTSATDAVIPAGTIIQPNSFFLIADVGFSQSKDNPLWPNANYEEAITLKNTDGGVALQDAEGNLIDAVGWGDPALIAAGFFEGTPHAGVASGNSLQRSQDTQNNAQDFSEQTPGLQSSNGGGNNQSAANASNSFLFFTITVADSMPRIINVSLQDEDALTQGIQVYPQPKAMKQVVITADIASQQNLSGVTIDVDESSFAMQRIAVLPNKTYRYQGNLNLTFFEAAGTKTVTVTANNPQGSSTASVQFDYLSLNAFEIDTAAIQCSLSPGQQCSVVGDMNMSSSDKVTIQNVGNTQLDMAVSGTDFKGASSIGVGAINYAFSNDIKKALTLQPQMNNIDLAPGQLSLVDLSLFVAVPQQVSAGTYASTIVLSSLVQ